MMAPKQRKHSSKSPQTELAFYIKLYCHRKGSTKTKYKNNLLEATKSWLSLSEQEKQTLYKKFKHCEEKRKEQLFAQLKTAKPFMKIKDVRDIDSTSSHSENNEPDKNLSNGILETELTESLPLEINSEKNYSNKINIDFEAPIPIKYDEEDLNNVDENDDRSNVPQVLLVEPIPPAIRTGHELFYMLNSTEDRDKIPWTSLPQFEKNQYSRAVTLLKKDYISKYKEYLESLSPKELFDHYYRICV